MVPAERPAQHGRRDERGQSLVEYALLVALVMLGLIGVVGAFMGAIGDFYLNVVKIVALPFP